MSLRPFTVTCRKILLLVVLLQCLRVGAQGPADWWYFGSNAGVNFPNSANPVAVNQRTTEYE